MTRSTIFVIGVTIFFLKIFIKEVCDAESRDFAEWATEKDNPMMSYIERKLKTYPRVSSQYDAEEIYNEIFLKIQDTIQRKITTKKGKWKSLIENYQAYFIQVVNFYLYELNNDIKVNVDICTQLQHFTEPFHLDQDNITSLEDSSVPKILSFLKEKNPIQHKVFMLKAYDENDFSQIAQILNLNVDNVRQIYCRARSKLQDFLLAGQRT